MWEGIQNSLAGWLLVLAVLGIAFRGAARIYIYYETHRRGGISQRLGLLSQSSADRRCILVGDMAHHTYQY